MVRVNEEKDRKIVVAKVNGKDILKGELLDQYKQYTSYYGVSEGNEKQTKSDLLDDLIRQELVKQKSEAAGYKVSDEIRAQAEKDYAQMEKDYAQSLKDKAGKDADKNTDYEAQAKKEMEDSLKAAGVTKDEYIGILAENIAVQKYLDELTKDLTVEDKEIKEYYNKELDFQKTSPTLSASYSTVKIVTEPATRRVKHILIKLSDEDTAAITKLRQDNKADDANKLREEKLKGIKSKADKALADVKAGGDFEALIRKYGEDPGMVNEENKDGYTMVRDASMRPEFLEESFKLKEGEISGLVATDNGYHIIKVYGATEDVIAPLADVKEDIKKELLNTKKNTKINELIDQWKKEATIKIFDKRF
jgi:foldase protein PrsA